MVSRKYKAKPLNIAFDIDDTIWKIRRSKPTCSDLCQASEHNDYCLTHMQRGDFMQIPDYDLIQVLRWFYQNGDNVFIWSAGGKQYAEDIAKKLGLYDMVTVVEKKHDAKDYGLPAPPKMDIAFDDSETNLAKVDIKIPRPYND